MKKKNKKSSSVVVNAAPLVALDLRANQVYMDPRKNKDLLVNPTVEQMWTPVAGPHNPFRDTQLGADQGLVQNAVTGYAEKTHMDNFTFDEQYHTFMRHG